MGWQNLSNLATWTFRIIHYRRELINYIAFIYSMLEIILTEIAQEKLVEFAKRENKPPVVRIGIRGGGCSGFTYDLSFEEAKETDTLCHYPALTLAIEQKSLTYLQGLKIDYKQSLSYSGFVYENPNAKSSCGCGNSSQF